MGDAKELSPEIENEVQNVLEELFDVTLETPALQNAKKQLNPLLGQHSNEATIKGLLAQGKTTLTGKDFRKLLDYVNLELIARHRELLSTLDRLGLGEKMATSTIQDKEKRLLALCGMGLSSMLPPGQPKAIAPLIDALQHQAKGLLIPDGIEFKLTPRLNQEIGVHLKTGTLQTIDLAASALLLAQLGVPENTLLRMVKNGERSGLFELLYRFRAPTSKPTPRTSFKLQK